ncbi:MAG TPA: helix-turn-helix domain-containing protein [Verrucomicrobiae bacterium]|jgi:hypothetical protein|nr:helix-turn-helix domain-containing protein [Verrucomicrobiae bacterium]
MKLSEKQKRKIVALARRGWKQGAIARELGLHPQTVAKTQRAAGLPTRPYPPDVLILELFQEGWSGGRIAKYLRTSVSHTYAVAHRHHFQHVRTIKGDVLGFVEAVKKREGYILHLARKFGLGLFHARRLARAVLGVEMFRRGGTAPPLTAYDEFPARERKGRKR